jgi:hypothetical protein
MGAVEKDEQSQDDDSDAESAEKARNRLRHGVISK